MQLVALTALGIGFSTIFGVLIGFLFKEISHKMNDMILGFASGVMLAAAVLGLILPSLEYVDKQGIWMVFVGILGGAVVLNILDRLTPHLHHLVDDEKEESHTKNTALMNKTLLFVLAIAIHNFPEGLATGVSFGTGNIMDAFTVAAGIALQNIPEGMIVVFPLLASGVSRKRTFLVASFTGIVEMIATFVGYFAISISSLLLPFLLAFAGGTMLYVICDEMIPETHGHGHEQLATYSLLIGFCVMLFMDVMLG